MYRVRKRTSSVVNEGKTIKKHESYQNSSNFSISIGIFISDGAIKRILERFSMKRVTKVFLFLIFLQQTFDETYAIHTFVIFCE